MADTTTAQPTHEEKASRLPSGSSRSSPVQNPNNSHPYHPPPPGANGYPYHPPPPHMGGSPNTHNAPPGYPMYPQYPPMNGPPPPNYPPQNPGSNSPTEGGGAAPPPPHYNMYHHIPPYHHGGMPPPNWNPGQHPGGPEGYGWGAPPPHHGMAGGSDGHGGDYPAQDVRDLSETKDGDLVKDEEREPKGDTSESINRHHENEHNMPPPSYYHPYPPYGNPPPPYQNPDNPAEAPPNASHYPNYPGHQYGPPPPYGHPPPHQPYPYPPEMNPYAPYPPMPGSYPPYYGQGSPSSWKGDKKRPRPSPAAEVPYGAYPPNKRYNSNPDPNTKWAPKRASQFPTSKSVRRKKKMYSDYVGVTYNKTHAKYQACITHYRKQHYLGRYKLAVDAALAYDESARLLKGTSWKVNFPTKQAYEEAKIRELESHGAMGGRAIDLEKAMATVASKVEEIASKTGNTGVQNLVVRPESRLSIDPTLPVIGGPRFVSTDGKGSKHTPFAHMSGMDDSPSMSKVTPSPSGQNAPSHHEHLKQASIDEDDSKTPLPETPNPTRHVMGADPTTPDSVIKPTVLSYLGKGGQRVEVLAGDHKSPEAVTIKADSIPHPPRQFHSASKIPCTPKTKTFQREALTSPRPVIQNGTLAAASALMTLFGNENSPKGS